MAVNFRKTVFKGVAARLDQCPVDNLPEIVMSGRSNVGKSSLINLLAGQNKLARVSNTPGKTRMVIYFLVDDRFYLTDLPGYGYAKVSKKTKAEFSELVDQYLSASRPISMVLHLMDIRHKPSEHDLQMIEWLSSNQIPWRLVLTKSDKLSRAQINKQLQVLSKVQGMQSAPKPMVFSAINKQGLHEMRELIAGVFDDIPLKTD
jgi:GTP-binding protein